MPITALSTLKEYLPELTGTTADTELTNLISRAESALALHLGFPVYDGGTLRALDVQTYTVYIDKAMDSLPDVLQLPFRPVVSITSVHADTEREYGSETEIAAAEYELDKENARLVLKPRVASNGFSSGYRSNKVVLTAGWSAAPKDLEHAVCVYCTALHRAKSSQGKKSLNQRGASTVYDPRTLPEEVKQIIYPYRSSAMII